MPMVRANPSEYLLVGRRGGLENRGSAVQAFLWPGTVHVIVPASKQEATFEFTQETKDGIPLRFKGIVIYRITDPVAAAHQFDFWDGAGIERISTLVAHVCLGELRHAVAHMTMAECFEERKTTLSAVVAAALEAALASGEAGPGANGWGIGIEVAQVAQVFIVDSGLRAQMECDRRVRAERLESERHELQLAIWHRCSTSWPERSGQPHRSRSRTRRAEPPTAEPAAPRGPRGMLRR